MRQSLAVAGGLLLSERCSAARRTAAGAAPRAVIVGAGFAGLACALELTVAGYQVVVLEARDRIGGRVHTLRDFVANKTVEAGGEFVGSNHPTWLAYAKRFGLTLTEIPETRDLASPVILDGKRISKIGVIALFQQIQEVYDRLTDAAREIDADTPWTAPHAAELDRQSLAQWLDRQEIEPRVRLAIEAESNSYGGVPTTRESYLGMLTSIKGGGLDRYWTENEAFRCTEGNQELAHRLAGEIGRDKIILGAPAAQIRVADDKVAVVCADGRTYEADDVIVTVPAGALGNLRFEPALPAPLNPQMGRNVKFLFALRDAVWERNKLPPTSMSDGPIGFTWSATAGQGGGPEQALVAFAGGAAADKLRQLPAAERETLARDDLAGRFPGFSEVVSGIRFVDWPGEPFTRGSYATAAPGEITTLGPLWARGLGRLHFAGEHTCYKFVGFMEGALTSGASVAQRLAVRDGLVGH